MYLVFCILQNISQNILRNISQITVLLQMNTIDCFKTSYKNSFEWIYIKFVIPSSIKNSKSQSLGSFILILLGVRVINIYKELLVICINAGVQT